jgi:hypothetical protein
MTWRGRLKGLLLIVVSVAAAAGCFLAFTSWMSAQTGRYEDYRAARACPAGEAARAWEDCLRTVAFTVTDVEFRTTGRRGEQQATVVGTPFWDRVVDLGSPDPLLRELREGDRVTGTIWRGEIMALAKGDLRQNTPEEPRDEPQVPAIAGTLAGLLALLSFAFGAIRLAGRPGLQQYAAWRPYGRRLLIAVLVTGFGGGLLFTWLGIPWWLTPAAIVAVTGCAAALIYGWDAEERARARLS